MTNLASTASAITDEQIEVFTGAFGGAADFYEAVRSGLTAAIIAAPTAQPTVQAPISKAEWRAAAKAVYLEDGDDEATADECARYLCREQDWHGEVEDPTEAARNDLRERPRPERAAVEPSQPAAEPIAWESTTAAFIKFVTQSRYDKFSAKVRAWYKPYHCSSCASRTPAPAAPDGYSVEFDKQLRPSLHCHKHGIHVSISTDEGVTLGETRVHIIPTDAPSGVFVSVKAHRPDDLIQAERYRKLRAQIWDRSRLFVVAGGKQAIQLGVDCPRTDRLDELVDALPEVP